MITIITSSYRVLDFLRECRISYQKEPVGLTAFRISFRVNNLEDIIRWHEGVYHTQLVVRYMGLNTFQITDTDDLQDKFLSEISKYHAYNSSASSKVPSEES